MLTNFQILLLLNSQGNLHVYVIMIFHLNLSVFYCLCTILKKLEIKTAIDFTVTWVSACGNW